MKNKLKLANTDVKDIDDYTTEMYDYISDAMINYAADNIFDATFAQYDEDFVEEHYDEIEDLIIRTAGISLIKKIMKSERITIDDLN